MRDFYAALPARMRTKILERALRTFLQEREAGSKTAEGFWLSMRKRFPTTLDPLLTDIPHHYQAASQPGT
jgi:hypothetical protein